MTMTDKPKTPTLADLRRLAKRKVGRIDREKSGQYGHGALAFVFDWLRFSSAERGGFGACEMDMFLPDWRERVHALSRPSEAPAPAPSPFSPSPPPHPLNPLPTLRSK